MEKRWGQEQKGEGNKVTSTKTVKAKKNVLLVNFPPSTCNMDVFSSLDSYKTI